MFELIDRTPVGSNKGSHVVTPFLGAGAARCSLRYPAGLKGSVNGLLRAELIAEVGGSEAQVHRVPFATTLSRAPNGVGADGVDVSLVSP